MQDQLNKARRETRGIYRRHADGWDRHRPRVGFEKRWLDRLLEERPVPLHCLDLGCGTGEPLTRYILELGHDYTGLDYAPEMLEMARKRFPSADFVEADMRTQLPAGPFDAVFSWDGSFHLTQEEQRALIARLPDHLTADGRVLLTIGDAAGEVLGTVEGEAVFHASLSPSEYTERFQSLGFEVEVSLLDEASDMHSVLLARRLG